MTLSEARSHLDPLKAEKDLVLVLKIESKEGRFLYF